MRESHCHFVIFAFLFVEKLNYEQIKCARFFYRENCRTKNLSSLISSCRIIFSLATSSTLKLTSLFTCKDFFAGQLLSLTNTQTTANGLIFQIIKIQYLGRRELQNWDTCHFINYLCPGIYKNPLRELQYRYLSPGIYKDPLRELQYRYTYGKKSHLHIKSVSQLRKPIDRL